MFVTKDYQPKRKPLKSSKFGGEKDTMKNMTGQAEIDRLEFEQFLTNLNPDQQRAVNEALCRLNDYVSGAGHKRIFGIIIPAGVARLEKLLTPSPE